jgi:hypothetical protein
MQSESPLGEPQTLQTCIQVQISVRLVAMLTEIFCTFSWSLYAHAGFK